MARLSPHTVLALLCTVACSGAGDNPQPGSDPEASAMTADDQTPATPPDASLETATFGAGCFWCVEAVLEQVDGIVEVTSGYMGGHVENPTYQQVCEGTTGHAEVVQVKFDRKRITYGDLLAWFWQLHDPTTRDRQGGDVGPQYRSVIFFHSDAQRALAEEQKRAQDATGKFPGPIVTEIAAAGTYYRAEPYHQDYYRQNKSQGYCRAIIAPKLDKLGLDR